MTSGGLRSGLRVVVAEHAPDGQDGRGTLIARSLRDAGHEVVYTGAGQSSEQVVETAIQEDADLICIATAGEDPLLVATVVGLLEAREAGDIEVRVGSNEVTRWVVEHFAQEPTAG